MRSYDFWPIDNWLITIWYIIKDLLIPLDLIYYLWFFVITLSITTIYNIVQIRWVFIFCQRCHRSQARKFVIAKPSGL